MPVEVLSGDALLVVSVCSFPHLIAASGPCLTLMESWDHPRSRPAGYRTEIIAGWNEDLTADWIRYQGAGKGIVGYPTKLRYAIENPVRQLDPSEAAVQVSRGRLLYAATSSANTPHGWLFREELNMLHALAGALERLGLLLHVKPKPNGTPGEFDEVEALHRGVTIGRYGAASSPADYALDAEYNEYRLDELASVDAVISVATTYGLDAAAAGVPVLQLDVRRRVDLPDLATAQHAWHLSHHLLTHAGTVALDDESDLSLALEHAVEEGLASATRYSSNLRGWLIPAGTFEDAVQRVASCLEEMTA